MNEHVTILGGGVVGLCVATELAARGVDADGGRSESPARSACLLFGEGRRNAGSVLRGRKQPRNPSPASGKRAADWWARAGVEVAREGSLVVTLGRDRAELDRFARRTAGHQSLSREALPEIEPQLDGRFDRALFFADEAHITPRDALGHLRDSP